MEITDSTNNQDGDEPMIDFGYLDEITGGDEELKGELIIMFETETAIQLENISNANKQSNYDVLKQTIHKYRSSLFSVGLLKTASKYKDIETDLKLGKPVSNLTALLNDLENESKLGLKILKSL